MHAKPGKYQNNNKKTKSLPILAQCSIFPDVLRGIEMERWAKMG